MRPLFHFARASRSMLVSHDCCSFLLASHARCARFRVRAPKPGSSAQSARNMQAEQGILARFARSLHDSAQFARSCQISRAIALRNEFPNLRFPFGPQFPCRLSSLRKGAGCGEIGLAVLRCFAGRRMLSLKETASCTQEGRVSGLYLLARSSWRRTPFALNNGRDCAISLFTWR